MRVKKRERRRDREKGRKESIEGGEGERQKGKHRERVAERKT